MDGMQGRATLLVWVSPVGFHSLNSTPPGSHSPCLHSFRKIENRVRRKKSVASAWDEQGDPKISVVELCLPAVAQRRLAGALARLSLNFLAGKHLRCVRHPARRQVCQRQESYV